MLIIHYPPYLRLINPDPIKQTDFFKQCAFEKEESAIIHLIAETAQSMSVPAYLVGGYVRDKILIRPSKDIDVTCVGSGIELAEAVALKLDPAPKVNVFKNFGTAQIKFHAFDIEFVGARKESYREDSRKPSVEDGSLQDDLNRRDFTINALAVSLNKEDSGNLIDSFNGLVDLENGLIRTPLEPGITFSDDPLRMMRAIRFASQLNFKIEESTFDAICDHRDRIRIISMERVSDELNKILLSQVPSVGFLLLYKCGLLEIIFPEMLALRGAENRDGFGHKDNFHHTLQVLDNICQNTDDLWVRWAALLHDIGKPATKRFEEKGGWTFHGHEVVGARMVPKIFARLKLPLNEKMKLVQKLVLLHLRPISLTKESITDSAIRRLLFDAGEDLESLMCLCEADITSKNKVKVKRFLSNFELVRQKLKDVEARDHLRNWQPPITGEIIMKTFNISPGKEIGIIKDAVREAVLDGKIPGNFDAAYNFMLEKGKEIGLKKMN